MKTHKPRGPRDLLVASPDFSMEEPWGLLDGKAGEVEARILDPAFIRKVRSGRARFGAGSRIRASLWRLPGLGTFIFRVRKGPF